MFVYQFFLNYAQNVEVVYCCLNTLDTVLLTYLLILTKENSKSYIYSFHGVS